MEAYGHKAAAERVRMSLGRGICMERERKRASDDASFGYGH